jgi:50S ribosomal protein L16 3-hydroxylase
MILDGFDHAVFLRDYWQQKPLLIRHRGSPFEDPLEADELAGLACEEAVESRLVTGNAGGQWQLCHGPFTPQAFTTLGEKDWTLLVQAVDQLEPEVDALKIPFCFLPTWAIDDVMVSFACDGGSVGPHYDQYDVFLIQGAGRRRWQLGQYCDGSTPLRQDTELRILQDFQPASEYLLETGDILYLPPRIAHYGVSLGESLCYSVGFRAPSLAELIEGLSDKLAEAFDEGQRFIHPADQPLPRHGAISAQSVSSAFQKLGAFSEKNAIYSDVFGEFATRPRYPERILPVEPAFTAQTLRNLLRDEPYLTVISKNPSSRFAYLEDAGRLTLYVDGQSITCQQELLPLLQTLAEQPWPQPLEAATLMGTPETSALTLRLLNQGSLLLDA